MFLRLNKAWHTNSLIVCLFRARYFLFCSIIIAAFLFIALPAHAQTTDEASQANATETAGELVVASESTEAPPEVLKDEFVRPEDLDAVRARILPDSPLHAFKRFGWNMQEFFTFDPVKDAELKFKHANQHLAEVHQLAEEKGFENIRADMIDQFERRLGSASRTAERLKDIKDEQPEDVERFLDDYTEKQLKGRTLLDTIGKGIFEEIEQRKQEDGENAARGLERVVAKVQETKEEAIEDLTEVLLEVEDSSEDVSDRITEVLEKETGSEFKELKHLEVLEVIHDRVPDSAKDAIENARRKTLERFEVSIKELPAAVRADKFEQYVEHASADEVRLMSILEHIKQNAEIPLDMIDAIEEAKEIAVRNFEEKLELESIRETFFENFDREDVNDLHVMSDIRSRMDSEREEFRIMEEYEKQSLDAFVSEFKDSESQDQAERFRKLSEEMTKNPTPKTFRLLQELEEEVKSDPTKRAFLEKLEQDMQHKTEERFKREGDKFWNRVTTLDPEDIAVFENLHFEDSFVDEFAKKNAERFKRHMQDIVEPEDFDKFHERFFDVPDFVINEIRNNDDGFQDAIQFKRRKMEERRAEKERDIARASLDFRERELHHEFDRQQRKEEEKFWEELNDVDWEDFEERKKLWEEKIDDRYEIATKKYEEQKKIFEERLKLDPWCDDVCQQIQLQFIEQDLRHEKERLADDLIRERNRIESEQIQHRENNPLAGLCKTPEECDAYCKANSSVKGCEWAIQVEDHPECQPPGYWDYGLGYCVTYDDFLIDCQPGHYYDAKIKQCVKDPYYVPPVEFKNCGWGMHWDYDLSYCVPDQKDKCEGYYDEAEAKFIYPPECHKTTSIDCKQGYRWDEKARDCVPFDYKHCDDGFYYDDHLNKCEPKDYDCGYGKYYNFKTQKCEEKEILACPEYYVAPCAPGFYREPVKSDNGCWIPGECIKEEVVCNYTTMLYCPEGTHTVYTTDEKGCSIPDRCEKDEEIKPDPFRYTFPDGITVYSNEEGVAHCEARGTDAGEKMIQACKDHFDVILVEKKDDKPTWVKYTWYFYDGDSESSYILDRTDSEYNSYIVGIAAECKKIVKSEFYWMPDAGNDKNWKTFGIPNCTGGASDYVCGDNICSPGELDTCASDCKKTEYEGDENSCPGFAYSKWDKAGKRYCQLNTEFKCDYNYPSYLTNGSNYDATNCPQDFVENGSCNYNGSCDSGETYDSCSDCSGTPSCGEKFEYNKETESCITKGVTCSAPKSCDSCKYGSSSGLTCKWDDNGCPTGCQDYSSGNSCGNGTCDNGETKESCYADCSGGVYEGDKDSCPGFAYSRWDSAGVRYCQLNNEKKCDYNYPGYLTNGSNYHEDNCPSETSTTPDPTTVNCDDYSTDSSCFAQSSCKWFSSEGCKYKDYVPPVEEPPKDPCNYNFTCDDGETVENCPKDCKAPPACKLNQYNNFTGDKICDSTLCADGCVWDSSGCATGCGSSTSGSHSSGSDSSGSSSGSTSSGSTGDSWSTSCSEWDGWEYNSQTGSCVKAGVTCSSPNSCDDCKYGSSSDKWCKWDDNGCPTGCQEGSYTSSDSYSSACDNDGTCESGESSGSCPNDCGSGSDSNTFGSGDCSSNYNYCYTESDCTGAGYGWCNGYCWSSYESSSCASNSDSSVNTSFSSLGSSIPFDETPGVSQFFKIMKSLANSFMFVTKAMDWF